jgi:hypothetical protein
MVVVTKFRDQVKAPGQVKQLDNLGLSPLLQLSTALSLRTLQGELIIRSASFHAAVQAGVKLYKFEQGAWQLHSAVVQPHFYNSNKDKEDAKADWQLVIDEADIETRADATLEYLVQFDQHRVTFKVPATQGLWSLKLPSLASVKQFVETLQVQPKRVTYWWLLSDYTA